MKNYFAILLALLALTTSSRAQNKITDQNAILAAAIDPANDVLAIINVDDVTPGYKGNKVTPAALVDAAGLGTTDDVTFNNLNLPTTTSTAGRILVNSVVVFHRFGTNNMFWGAGAGNYTLTGTQNTSFGAGGLSALTSGVGNTVGGYNAGLSLADSTGNVALGYAALDAQVSGTGSVAIGYNALTAQGTVAAVGNAAVGYNAGAANLTGAGQIFIGYEAGKLVTGASNTVVGSSALDAEVAGVGNTAIGRGVLGAQSGVTGSTAVGFQAGFSNVTGASLTLMGYNAGAGLTAGPNTAFGFQSLDANTSGTNNTAVGSNSLGAAGTATDNTAVGSNAGLSLTGNFNTAVGSTALDAEVAGVQNAAFGYAALGASNGGSFNTALGTNTGKLVSTGDNNIFLGWSAGDAVTSGSSNIIIGYDLDALSATGSNQLNIGGVIFSDGVNTATGTGVSTGNVGIGLSTAPVTKLQVAGGVTLNDIAALTATAGTAKFWSQAGEMQVIDASGNITPLSPHPKILMEELGITGSAATLGMDFTKPENGVAVAQPKARWLEWYVELQNDGTWTKFNFDGEEISSGFNDELAFEQK